MEKIPKEECEKTEGGQEEESGENNINAVESDITTSTPLTESSTQKVGADTLDDGDKQSTVSIKQTMAGKSLNEDAKKESEKKETTSQKCGLSMPLLDDLVEESQDSATKNIIECSPNTEQNISSSTSNLSDEQLSTEPSVEIPAIISNDELISEPVNEKLRSEPISEEPRSEPINEELRSGLVNEELRSEAVNEELQYEPVNQEPLAPPFQVEAVASVNEPPIIPGSREEVPPNNPLENEPAEPNAMWNRPHDGYYNPGPNMPFYAPVYVNYYVPSNLNEMLGLNQMGRMPQPRGFYPPQVPLYIQQQLHHGVQNYIQQNIRHPIPPRHDYPQEAVGHNHMAANPRFNAPQCGCPQQNGGHAVPHRRCYLQHRLPPPPPVAPQAHYPVFQRGPVRLQQNQQLAQFNVVDNPEELFRNAPQQPQEVHPIVSPPRIPEPPCDDEKPM